MDCGESEEKEPSSDNWDKQGTLEQMESVEQLGNIERNLVRPELSQDATSNKVQIDDNNSVVNVDTSAVVAGVLNEDSIADCNKEVNVVPCSQAHDEKSREASHATSSDPSLGNARGVLERQNSLHEDIQSSLNSAPLVNNVI